MKVITVDVDMKKFMIIFLKQKKNLKIEIDS